jgi:WD40 repeat protein
MIRSSRIGGQLVSPPRNHPESTLDAFISYSHAADEPLAVALQRALQRFAKPLLRLRSLRVFRDDENLAASANLDKAIEDALAQSRFLILLASPQAAASRWVAKEAQWWLENRSPDRLLICLTSGTITWDTGSADFDWFRTTAVPRVLSGVFTSEPRYARLDRLDRTPAMMSLDNAAFREAVRDLAAPIHGVSKDALESEDVRLHRRARQIARIALATLSVLTVTSAAGSWIAMRERNAARRQARIATSRGLAAMAMALRDTDPDHGRRVAADALSASRTPEAAAAFAATTFRAGLQREIGRPGSVKTVAVDPDAGLAVTASRDGMEIVNLFTGRMLRRLAEPLPWGWICDANFSPKGDELVAVDAYSTLAVWSVNSGRRLMSAVARGNPLRAEFSSDGRWIVTIGDNGETAVWNTATGKRLRDLGRNSYLGVAFSPAGPIAAFADSVRPRVVLLNLVTGHRVARIDAPMEGIFGAGVDDLAFSADGRSLAVALDFGVGVWSGRQWKQAFRLAGFRGYAPFRTVNFSQDGRFLIAGGEDRLARIWAWPSARLITVLRGHSDSITDAVTDAHGQLAATAGYDGTARLWSLRTGAALVTYKAEDGPLRHVWFAPDSKRLITLGADDVARIWRVPFTILRGHRGRVTAALFTQDERRVVSVGVDGTARSWNIRTGKQLEKIDPISDDWAPRDFYEMSMDAQTRVVLLQGAESFAWNLDSGRVTRPSTRVAGDAVISPDGRFVSALDFGGRIRIWRTSDGKIVRSLRVSDATELRLDPTGNIIVTDPLGNRLRVWDWNSGRLLHALPAADGGFARSAFDPTGKLLAVAEWESASTARGYGWHGYVRIWDWHTGKLQHRLEAGVGPIVNHPPAFSSNGARLLVISGNAIYVWETGSGELLARLSERMGTIGTAHFDASGRYVIAVGADSTARIFDIATGSEIAVLADHRGQVTEANFSPHDRWLLTAGTDGEIHVYPCNFCRPPTPQQQR